VRLSRAAHRGLGARDRSQPGTMTAGPATVGWSFRRDWRPAADAPHRRTGRTAPPRFPDLTPQRGQGPRVPPPRPAKQASRRCTPRRCACACKLSAPRTSSGTLRAPFGTRTCGSARPWPTWPPSDCCKSAPPAQRDPQRATARRSQQPGSHRTGQGQARRAPRPGDGSGIHTATGLRTRPQPAAVRIGPGLHRRHPRRATGQICTRKTAATPGLNRGVMQPRSCMWRGRDGGDWWPAAQHRLRTSHAAIRPALRLQPRLGPSYRIAMNGCA
jgi:hypothetical protein